MKTILTAGAASLVALSTAFAPALAQPVDPSFGVEEPSPVNVLRRNGIHPIARIFFFPILPFVELQAYLSPEKASCWNDRAEEVAGCVVVEERETAEANRPTPYFE